MKVLCNPYSLFCCVVLMLGFPLFFIITLESITERDWSTIYSLIAILGVGGILGSPTITMNESGLTINRYFNKRFYPLRNIKSVKKEELYCSRNGSVIGIVIYLKTGKKASVSTGNSQADKIVNFYEMHLA